MKKERKEEQKTKREEKKARIKENKKRERNHLAKTSSRFAVYRIITPPGSEAELDDWVQSKFSELWFHLVCVDLNDAPDGEWLWGLWWFPTGLLPDCRGTVDHLFV